MLRAQWWPHRLTFKQPAVTSREVLLHKVTYFVELTDGSATAIGEAPLFDSLTPQVSRALFEQKLDEFCANPSEIPADAPSGLIFGVETARMSLAQGGSMKLFADDVWTSGGEGITINGLVWMGNIAQMRQRVAEKLDAGFSCIKLKIGAQLFADELAIIAALRREFSESVLQIRVDANGAFSRQDAEEKLAQLARLNVHSIEQPLPADDVEGLQHLCAKEIMPIALDESLMNHPTPTAAIATIETIPPQYLVLKPSLTGGFAATHELIEYAKANDIGWWITSALESNVGLNALAQFTYREVAGSSFAQGLGTGNLYTNNIISPLRQRGEKLYYDPQGNWELPSKP
jgi:o-succinylbenzoate synthase